MDAYATKGGSKERFFGRTSSQKEGVIVKICSILKDEKQDLAQKIEGIDKLITTSELGKHRNYFQGDKLTKSLEMANRALEILKLQVKEQASNTSTPTP